MPSFAEAIRAVMDAKGIPSSEVVHRIGDHYNRGNFYRLLSGQIQNPRISAFVAVCTALDVSPTELLQQAGLWPFGERAPDALDVQLRGAFGSLQTLPLSERERAVHVISAIAEGWQSEQ